LARLAFVPDSNPIHKIGPTLYTAACHAQESIFERVFVTADSYLQLVTTDLRIALSVPPELSEVPALEFAEKSFAEFQQYFSALLKAQSYPEQAVLAAAQSLASRAMLTRAFADPDEAVTFVRNKIVEVVQTLPRSGKDIECGRNKGDVLDPFILAATQYLLYQGEFDSAISAVVSHKALMILEGLLGHLHEDVLGRMRGNFRAPEPRGEDQEAFDYTHNPFPGADLVQPPAQDGQKVRMHQIKSKTGSAKGGDGKRLGDQLKFLHEHYDADVFYDALVGNTLVGHRSRKGVEKAAPMVAVLVGQSAFTQLTGSNHGAAFLLRLYQESFVAAAAATGYSISEVTKNILVHFQGRAEQAGEGFLEVILKASTGGKPQDQDSRRKGN
jgi:hypothetical protein